MSEKRHASKLILNASNRRKHTFLAILSSNYRGTRTFVQSNTCSPLAHGGLHIAGRRDSNQNIITIDLFVKNHLIQKCLEFILTGLAVSASVTGAAYVRNLVN